MRFILGVPDGIGAFLGSLWATWTSRTVVLQSKEELQRHLAWIQEEDQRVRAGCGVCERVRTLFARGRARIARDLMTFISELQWDAVGVPRNPYAATDPMHQVAASLLVVKTDFDALILERDRRERELDRARRKAEEVNRLQARFLANVSHEIRTPLNAVIGMGDLLTDTDLDARQHDLLRTLRQSAQGLLAVINDILDLSRMEAGEFHLVDEPFRLASVLGEVGSMIGYLASTKGIGFRMERVPELPAGLRGDSLRLRQILVNLAGNAVKFTEDGEVVVRVERGGCEDPSRCRIAIEVEDSGPGIPILALTAHAMDGDREQFLSAGMDGYLSKPIRFAQLRSTLEDLLCRQPPAA